MIFAVSSHMIFVGRTGPCVDINRHERVIAAVIIVAGLFQRASRTRVRGGVLDWKKSTREGKHYAKDKYPYLTHRAV
ncbi:MAG: hypothetical protein KJ871_06885 [Alphaproteobacteria bacterium]|nr:hypothetical protein [Alphaproteobacteria bacterium]MBU2082773.1 hypothetical protein [Alphaproteobacteria bacterium]MBU2143809.1 hypothetical protein [Alphaproteobacteria bacterium]MBU2196104.1 hypothetical protein [Alphaproteobacteria bacterium]